MRVFTLQGVGDKGRLMYMELQSTGKLSDWCKEMKLVLVVRDLRGRYEVYGPRVKQGELMRLIGEYRSER